MAAFERKAWKSQAFAEDIQPICNYCLTPNAEKKCGKCRSVYYCNADCCNAHWTDHKTYCQISFEKIMAYLCDQKTINRLHVLAQFRSRWYEIKNDDFDAFLNYFRTTANASFVKLEKAEMVVDVKNRERAVEECFHTLGFQYQIASLLPEDHSNNTGCVTALYLLTILCMSRTKLTIHSEMLGLISFIDRVLGEQTQAPFHPFTYLHADPSKTFDSIGQYLPQATFHNFFTEGKCPNDNYVYFINIHPHSSTCKSEAVTSSEPAVLDWKDFASKKQTTNHYLLLLRTKTSSMIIQSFFAHYTFVEWCNFGAELKQIEKPPLPDDNFGDVNPKPYYRGRMNAKKLRNFFISLKSLTVIGRDHRKEYARITGVTLPPEQFPPRYAVFYFRLDLNNILY